MPEKLGPYSLAEPPFEGGFGRVYKATRPDHPGRFFALKVPRDPTNEEHLRLLKREAKVLSRVRHQNLIKLLDNNLDSNPPYIVLEYLPGGSARSLVGKADYATVLWLAYQIAGALGAVHQAGGFHRDIKPDNILLGPDGSFILADLNIANVPSTSSKLTRHVAGTKGYIDPWAVNRGFDWAADIWSFGATIAELITGKKPTQCVSPKGLLFKPSDLKIDDQLHREAFYRLLQAMLSSEPAVRPAARLVHQYTWVLMNGGQLPALAASPPVRQQPQGADLGGVLVATAIAGLLIVGIAALLKSE